jgi:3-dehydroquinate synthase
VQPLRVAVQVPFEYPVHFTRDALHPGNPLLADVVAPARDDEGGPRRVLFVLDGGLAERSPWLLPAVHRYCACHAGRMELAGTPLVVPGGEAAKSDPELVTCLHAAIDAAGLCRHSYVVAVGGGAVLDLAGYAAATAHRGVRLVRLPTTVLAQNDAGIGVKNGVNAFGKKNWVGTFAPPNAVVNDAGFLVTLSDRDWRAGISEAVKVALIKDAAFFRRLETGAGALARRDQRAMERLIHRCAQLHLAHIAAGGDPFERGSARPLDFGHWAAHRLERLTDHRLRHGEAVAIGIALDATYSRLAGHLPPDEWRRVVDVLRAVGFELFVPELAHDGGPDGLLRGLDEFRQHLGGRLTVTMLRRIGEGFELHEVDEDLVRESVTVLRQVGTARSHLRRLHDHGSGTQPVDPLTAD